MESTSQPGCVQVTEETFKLLQEHHTFNTTGGVEVKGKGIMSTYLWSPEEHPEEQYSNLEEKAQEVSALISHIGRQLGVDQATLLAPEITAPSRHSTGDTHQEGQPPTAIADVTLSDLMLSNLSISAVEREEEQDRTLVRQSTDAMGARPVVQGLLGTTEGAEGPSTATGPEVLESPVSPARGISTILSRVGTLRRPARPASGDREVLKHASAHLPKLEMLPVGQLAIAEASSSEHDLQRISPPRDAFNGGSMGNLLRIGPTGMLSGAIEGGKGGAESATLGTQVELLKSLLQTSRENQHQNASNSNWLGRGSGSLYTRGTSLSGGLCTSPVPPELAHLHATPVNHSLESTTDATSSSPKHQPVLVPRSNSLRPKPSLAERETHIVEDLSPHQEMPYQPSLVASLGLVLATQHPRSGSEQHMASPMASEQASLYRMRRSSLVHHMSREGNMSSKAPSKRPSRESIGRSYGSFWIGSALTSGHAFSSESITATPVTNNTMPGCSADSQNDAWH
ncbi:hypothetical protein CEUSTIGMA_g6144.t1 [Chlamydomonas eustigma]|uniref:Guanylate cyclase domain-containing protein n=1 Tax=Chlamydomonas eustigma TaxID=1157962 RepID=A0A250X6N5_9CHLO|nr:hypothetical protein CEUSTIGMA_g6144.t1 [Chlamydomonas eustigma]|eukprot:GAX78706.1 hypothetical protein CEUSTIGMA_g6144.t1 [Chlamydomonas eustigma]